MTPVLILGLLCLTVPLQANGEKQNLTDSFTLQSPTISKANILSDATIKGNPAAILFLEEAERPPSKLYIRSNLQTDRQDYEIWKKRLSRAKGKIAVGAVMEVIGLGLFLPSIAHVLFLPEGDRISSAGKVRVAVGSILGGGLIIFGSITLFKGISQKKKLTKEGRIKGYIRAGLFPKENAFGIQIGAGF